MEIARAIEPRAAERRGRGGAGVRERWSATALESGRGSRRWEDSRADLRWGGGARGGGEVAGARGRLAPSARAVHEGVTRGCARVGTGREGRIAQGVKWRGWVMLGSLWRKEIATTLAGLWANCG